jgi:hypothetical protein
MAESESQQERIVEALDSLGMEDFGSLREAANALGVPRSSLGHRRAGRRTQAEAAQSRQLLTPVEEKALVNYILRASAMGYPLPVRAARGMAAVIIRQRSSIFDESMVTPHVEIN